MNNVVLIGRLTRDPDLRYIPDSGKAITTFTLAVDRPFSREKTADFFRIVVFGKAAENCGTYLSKGRLAGVSGRLQNNNYETQSGEKRYSVDIIADRVEFLEPKSKSNPVNKENESMPDGFQALEDDDDDIPF